MQTRNPYMLATALLSASTAFAGSVDNRNNNSAGFIRNFSRNASTADADVSVYNPAGAVRLQVSSGEEAAATVRSGEQRVADVVVGQALDVSGCDRLEQVCVPLVGVPARAYGVVEDGSALGGEVEQVCHEVHEGPPAGGGAGPAE